MRDSNSRPLGPKPSALAIWANSRERMVGVGGLEPPTSPLSEVRSNRLSYTPILYNYLQSGAKRQNRTADTRLFRPLLYHWATLAQEDSEILYKKFLLKCKRIFKNKQQENLNTSFLVISLSQIYRNIWNMFFISSPIVNSS